MINIVEFTEFLGIIGILAVFIFIICSMISMGLKFSFSKIIDPLENKKLDLFSLIGNFAIVPIITLIVVWLLPLNNNLSTGLIILGCAAGAPFIPKLAEISKGNIAYSIGLMVMLMVGTIIFLPIVLPLIITGVQVDPWAIAKPLIFLMLIPLTISMLFRYRYSELADEFYPFFSKASSLALLVLIVAFFVLYYQQMASIVGSTGIIASIVIILSAFIVGYLLGTNDKGTKRTLAVGTAQRNLAATFAIVTTNFSNPEVLTMVMVFGLASFLITIPLGAELGKKSQKT